MKRLKEWLNTFQLVAPMYRGLESLTGYKPLSVDGKLAFVGQNYTEALAACPAGVVPQNWMDFLSLVGGTPTDMFESWVLAGLAQHGMKVYCPTRDEFDALGRVEMNVPWSMYRQPFETFVVSVPDDSYPAEVSEDVGRPAAVVLRIKPKDQLISVTVICDRCNLTSRFTWQDEAVESIEDHIGRMPNPPAGVCTELELTASDHAVRAGINACLLLTQYGTKRIGYDNPEYADKLIAKLANKKLPPAAREANQKALRSIPEVYGFDQHVRLYDGERSVSTSSDSDRVHRPHWRRGHWANVACGTGRTERKLVFRRPVMVNAHLFAGDHADTRVTITTK